MKHFQTLFHETVITEARQEHYKKIKSQANIPMKIDVGGFNKILANQIQECIKRIIHQD